MMYTNVSLGDGRSLMASRVAPPVPEDLSYEALRKLRVFHLVHAHGDSIREIADAIETAPLDQIELARTAILHALECLDREFVDIGNSMVYDISKANLEDVTSASTESFFRNVVENAMDDAESLLKEVKKSPSSKSKIAALEDLSTALAEITELGFAGAVGVDIRQRRAAFEENAMALRNWISTMPGGSPKAALANVGDRSVLKARLASQVEASGRVTPKDLDMATFLILSTAGEKFLYRHASLPPLERERLAIAKGFKSLKEDEANALRKTLVDALLMYADVTQPRGLIDFLRGMSNVNAYTAQSFITESISGKWESEARETNKRKSFASKTEKTKDLERALADIKRQKERQRFHSVILANYASDFQTRYEDLIVRASSVLDRDTSVTDRRTLRLTKDEATNAVIGTFDRAALPSILIYPDPFVVVEGAVYAMSAPASLIADGIPEFSLEVRGHPDLKATKNWYSIENAIVDLTADAFSQTFFFGGPVRVINEVREPEAQPSRRI